jgi:hypothetical protein
MIIISKRCKTEVLGYLKNLKGSQAEACGDRDDWGRASAEHRELPCSLEILPNLEDFVILFFLLDQKELKNQEKTMLQHTRPSLARRFFGPTHRKCFAFIR